MKLVQLPAYLDAFDHNVQLKNGFLKSSKLKSKATRPLAKKKP